MPSFDLMRNFRRPRRATALTPGTTWDFSMWTDEGNTLYFFILECIRIEFGKMGVNVKLDAMPSEAADAALKLLVDLRPLIGLKIPHISKANLVVRVGHNAVELKADWASKKQRPEPSEVQTVANELGLGATPSGPLQDLWRSGKATSSASSRRK